MTRDFPIGHRISLPRHFPEPLVLESDRSIGAGCECQVRLASGKPEEATIPAQASGAEPLRGQAASGELQAARGSESSTAPPPATSGRADRPPKASTSRVEDPDVVAAPFTMAVESPPTNHQNSPASAMGRFRPKGTISFPLISFARGRQARHGLPQLELEISFPVMDSGNKKAREGTRPTVNNEPGNTRISHIH
jgi:hypothetical protein